MWTGSSSQTNRDSRGARRFRRVFWVVLTLAAALAGCGDRAGGGSPAEPSLVPGALSLETGPQILTLVGTDISDDPAFPPCSGVFWPRTGKLVTTRVVLERTADEWIARAAPQAGDLELRFRQVGASPAHFTIEGSAEGTAIDLGDTLQAATRARVTITDTDGTASLVGDSPRSGFVAGGRIRGVATFTDDAGRGGSCEVISWTLTPARR